MEKKERKKEKKKEREKERKKERKKLPNFISFVISEGHVLDGRQNP